MTRADIFAAVRNARADVWSDPGHIHAMDNLLDAFGVPRDGMSEIVVTAPRALPRKVSPDCIELIKRFEGCGKRLKSGNLAAYPDPGTGGHPWTIGWGATGRDIQKGTIWTQSRADERLLHDIDRHAADVIRAIGDSPTGQAQFDALVSFHYNTGKIMTATLTKKHCAGDFNGAAKEFRRWTRAGGRVLKGLVLRRDAEEQLYRRDF